MGVQTLVFDSACRQNTGRLDITSRLWAELELQQCLTIGIASVGIWLANPLSGSRSSAGVAIRRGGEGAGYENTPRPAPAWSPSMRMAVGGQVR